VLSTQYLKEQSNRKATQTSNPSHTRKAHEHNTRATPAHAQHK